MKFYLALVWSLLLHAWPSVTLALEKALVEVVIYEHSSGGDYTTHTYELEGKFSNAGAATSAEGDILEVGFLLLYYKYSAQSFAHHRPKSNKFLLRSATLCGFVYLDSLRSTRAF